MKKALLLTLLAGSMLASCATAAKLNVNKNVKADPLAGIIEDTDAHEEVFGAALPGLKTTPMREAFYSDAIGIGIQEKDNKDETKSIRFVAAVTIPNADLAATTAVWQRGLYDNWGNAKVEGEMESHKFYTSLTNGESVLTIEAYNSAHGTAHTGFVVYTLLNVPSTGYSDYYMTAYLKVTDPESTLSRSKALVTSLDQGTQFTLDPEAYLEADISFGLKKGGSGYVIVNADVNSPNAESGNLAQFNALSLSHSEGFVAIRRSQTNQKFNVSGYQAMAKGNSDLRKYYIGLGTEGSSDFITPIYNSTACTFYQSAGYQTVGYMYLGTLAGNINATFYLTNDGTTWGDANAWYAFYYQDSNGAGHAEEMEETGTAGLYTITASLDPTKSMAFIRMDPSKNHDDALADLWNNWGQTVDYYLSNEAVVGRNKLTVKRTSGKFDGDWSVHS